MTAAELNELLKGKTISSVEDGTRAGWMVINIEPTLHERCRTFLTVEIGGHPLSRDGEHYWNCALHVRSEQDGGVVHRMRDDRVPKMQLYEPEPDTVVDTCCLNILEKLYEGGVLGDPENETEFCHRPGKPIMTDDGVKYVCDVCRPGVIAAGHLNGFELAQESD